MKEMSLTTHLEELRSSLIKIVAIVIVGFFLCYGVGEQITEFMLHPLRSALGTDGKVVYLGILDKVLAQFQLAFWSTIILTSPFWFYQIWKFIKPGLYDHEIKAIRPFIFISFFLFCAGIAFGYFLVFPFTFETILSFGVTDIQATISLRDYIVLTSKVLVFLGFLFQMPNVLVVLSLMGLTNAKKLTEARRYVIASFAVLSALLTPPDVITMMALWIPLVALYEVGVLIVRIMPKKKAESDIQV